MLKIKKQLTRLFIMQILLNQCVFIFYLYFLIFNYLICTVHFLLTIMTNGCLDVRSVFFLNFILIYSFFVYHRRIFLFIIYILTEKSLIFAKSFHPSFIIKFIYLIFLILFFVNYCFDNATHHSVIKTFFKIILWPCQYKNFTFFFFLKYILRELWYQQKELIK